MDKKKVIREKIRFECQVDKELYLLASAKRTETWRFIVESKLIEIANDRSYPFEIAQYRAALRIAIQVAEQQIEERFKGTPKMGHLSKLALPKRILDSLDFSKPFYLEKKQERYEKTAKIVKKEAKPGAEKEEGKPNAKKL